MTQTAVGPEVRTNDSPMAFDTVDADVVRRLPGHKRHKEDKRTMQRLVDKVVQLRLEQLDRELRLENKRIETLEDVIASLVWRKATLLSSGEVYSLSQDLRKRGLESSYSELVVRQYARREFNNCNADRHGVTVIEDHGDLIMVATSNLTDIQIRASKEALKLT